MSERLQKLANICAFANLSISALIGGTALHAEGNINRDEALAVAYADTGQDAKAEEALERANDSENTRDLAISCAIFPGVMGSAGLAGLYARRKQESHT